MGFWTSEPEEYRKAWAAQKAAEKYTEVSRDFSEVGNWLDGGRSEFMAKLRANDEARQVFYEESQDNSVFGAVVETLSWFNIFG